MRILTSFTLLSVGFLVSYFVSVSLPVATTQSLIQGSFFVGVMASLKGSFFLTDFLHKIPKQIQENKEFFKSKILWLAILNLISVSLKGFFGFELSEDCIEEILILDWTNILQALASTLIISLRKYDKLKLLNS